MVRMIDTRESIKTVTSNTFITAEGLSDLSIKARKLLYIAIAQCRKDDTEFYEYSLSVNEFARLMDVDSSNVYKEADTITDELMKGYIAVKARGKEKFKKYSLFQTCEYSEEGIIQFRLNVELTTFLLELKKDFTQTLLHDFLKMNSPYSMAIWHLIEKEIHGRKPGIYEVIEFNLSLEELREVTGTTDKLAKISHFKARVFDKALREIKDNCGVVITYKDIKIGRSTKGFRCVAVSEYHLERPELPPERMAEIERKAQELRARAEQRAKGEL